MSTERRFEPYQRTDPEGVDRMISIIRAMADKDESPYEKCLTRYAAQVMLGRIDDLEKINRSSIPKNIANVWEQAYTKLRKEVLDFLEDRNNLPTEAHRMVRLSERAQIIEQKRRIDLAYPDVEPG